MPFQAATSSVHRPSPLPDPATAVRVHLTITAAIAAINLSPLLESWTVRRLVHMNFEGNVTVWFSAATLLVLAGLATEIACLDAEARQRGWFAIAALFAMLSLDEVASLHELVGELFTDRVATLAWLPDLYAWVAILTPFALVVAWFLARWISAAAPRGSVERRWGLVAVGAWVLVPVAEALDPLLGAPHALIVLEESLELLGLALMLGAFLHAVRRLDPSE